MYFIVYIYFLVRYISILTSISCYSEVIEASSSRKALSSTTIMNRHGNFYVRSTKWFNIRMSRYLRHSFTAYLFLRDVKSRDDGHLSSDDSKMKLFILMSANERDSNRNPIADTPCPLRNSFERDHASRTLFTTIISPVDVIRSLPFDVLRGIFAKERARWGKKYGGGRKVFTINVA